MHSLIKDIIRDYLAVANGITFDFSALRESTSKIKRYVNLIK